MINQGSAYRYAIVAVLCWSTVSTAFKLSLRYFTPLGLLLYSSLTAAMLLSIYALVVTRKEEQGSVGRNLIRSLLPGLLNPFLYYLMLFEAYNRLRAQEAQVLNYTWAIVLPILSIAILKQHLRLRDIAGLLIGFCGVILIATRGAPFSLMIDDWIGSILAVGSSFVWAAYWLINMKDKRSPSIKLSFNFLAGVSFILIYIIIRNSIPGGITLFTDTNAGISPALIGGLYVGIFEMGLTFILWYKALTLSKSTALVSYLIFFTPFISLFFIQIFLKEAIHYATIAGLLLIITGNFVQKARDRHRIA